MKRNILSSYDLDEQFLMNKSTFLSYPCYLYETTLRVNKTMSLHP